MKTILLLLLCACAASAQITMTGCTSVNEYSTCPAVFNKPVSLSLAGGGSLSCTTACTSVVFTAPTGLGGKGMVRAGCPVEPIDSIYSTRIDAMPVNASNSTWSNNLWSIDPFNYWYWDGGAGGWGATVIDNTTPIITVTTLYPNGTAPNPDPLLVNFKKENGPFGDGAFGVDTHGEFINRQSCDIYESYAGLIQGAAREIAAHWNVSTTANNPYYSYYGGAGAVSGMPYAPLLVNIDDVKHGFTHPIDFAWLSVANGDNGAFAPSMFTNGYGWPASYSNLLGYPGYSNPPTGTLPGLGSWMRLSNAWCAANLGSYSGYVLNILTGLCHYGSILTDWTSGTAFGGHVDTSISMDPAALAALATAAGVVGNAWATSRSNIEWIDVSSLSTCSPWWNCNSVAVNPSNGHVTLASYSIITASDGGTDPAISQRINVVPITVGTLHPALIIPAGVMSTYQVTSYVNGTTNQGVTWSGTNVSSGGLFTIPSSETAITQFELTGASVVDSASKVYVTVFVVPSNADGIVRLDLGSGTAVWTDPNGKIWLSDQFLPTQLQKANYDTEYSNRNWPTGIADYNVWLTSTGESQGAGDLIFGDFVLPPGTKSVTWMYNSDNGLSSQQESDNSAGYNSKLDFGLNILSANNDVTGMINFGLTNPSNPFMTVSDQRATVPAVVGSDNILQIRNHSTEWHYPDGTCCIGFHHMAGAQGVYIQPYTGTTQLVIKTGQLASTHSGAGAVQCYLQDWGTGLGSMLHYDANNLIDIASDRVETMVWSVLPGGAGGTIGASSGLYTPPSSLTISRYDTIQAHGATSGTTVTAKIWVEGQREPAAF